MNISITIKNVFTGLVEMDTVRTIAEASIDAAHRQYELAYPNSFVNFVWGEEGSKSFICGMPHNMKRDEITYNEGCMTWEEYSEKWYFRK